MTEELDISNMNFVSGNGTEIRVLRPPHSVMSRQEAMVFAAWLVALAEQEDGEFAAILERVRNT